MPGSPTPLRRHSTGTVQQYVENVRISGRAQWPHRDYTSTNHRVIFAKGTPNHLWGNASP
jgi:hypothetical protein